MVMRCCGFYEGHFLKVSSLSTRMQKFRMHAHSINWLRDQPFEKGMIILDHIALATVPSWAKQLPIPSRVRPGPGPSPAPCAGAAGPVVRGAGGPSAEGPPERAKHMDILGTPATRGKGTTKNRYLTYN